MWFIFLGDITPCLIQLANRHWAAQVQAKAGRPPLAEGPHPARKLSAPALAASQGQAVHLRGVLHKLSDAKAARKAAKLLDAQVRNADNEWHRGQSSMTRWQWYELLEKRKARWVCSRLVGSLIEPRG